MFTIVLQLINSNLPFVKHGLINISGQNNTALGVFNLRFNTSGSQNTAIGDVALNNNTSGSQNTAIGAASQLFNQSGIENTSIGYGSLSANRNGNYNTAVGSFSLNSPNGAGNTAIGYKAGAMNNGEKNVFIGHLAGSTQKGSNKLVIENTDVDSTSALIYGEFDNDILRLNAAVGIGITPSYALHVSGGAHCLNGTTWIDASDARLKKDIEAIHYGLKEILALQPVEYNWKSNDHASIGFIAQDVKKIIPEIVSGKEGNIEKGETLGLSYGNLTAVLVKAIQDQQDIIKGQQKIIKELERRMAQLEKDKKVQSANIARIETALNSLIPLTTQVDDNKK